MDVCGLTEGREIGVIKKAIEEAILEGMIENTHGEALEYLLKIKDDYPKWEWIHFIKKIYESEPPKLYFENISSRPFNKNDFYF